MERTIKKATDFYMQNSLPDISIVRKRSDLPILDEAYKRKFDMEKYALCRHQEINYIYNYRKFNKYKNEILYLLNRLCNVYNKENLFTLLECYLLPVVKKHDFDSSKVIKYSLSIHKYADNILQNYMVNTNYSKLEKNSKMIMRYLDEEIYNQCMTVSFITPQANNIFFLWLILDGKEINLNYLYAILHI